MRPTSSASVRARIDLDAIHHNFETLRDQSAGARVMAVIKGNAYGHGLLEVADKLREAPAFGVSRIGEGRALRDAGHATPVVILGGVPDDDLDLAADLNLAVVVHTAEQAEVVAVRRGAPLDVWLKIDTGMHRLGVDPAAGKALLAKMGESGAVRTLSVMTHLACADMPEDPRTQRQADIFAAAIEGFEGDISIANSAGVLAWPALQRRFAQSPGSGAVWVRPGIALYGISPIPGRTAPEFGLRPAMRLEAPVVSVKSLGAGEAVGYGGAWRAAAATRIAIVAAGYADGYARHVSSGCPAIVNDEPASVAGVVSMDFVALDLGPRSLTRVGDTAVLWGGALPVEKIAEHARTIAYTLVSGVSRRVPRSYS